MKKISILVPTRGRPKSMDRLVESVFNTAGDPSSIQVVFYIDEDDKASQDKAHQLYARHSPADLFENPEAGIKAVVGPRIMMSDMWNKCMTLADADIFHLCGDDIVFKTNGWDIVVTETFDAFEDKILFAYGNDLFQPASFGTHGFIHRNWIATVGYAMPPYFSHEWCDTWLNDVAKAIGRHKYIDIVTEHLHYQAGKAAMDTTYREALTRGDDDNVKQKYIDYAPQREVDALKLQETINSFKGSC